jgi:ribosomal-protein-alanine N-acetyltransferase
MIEIVRRLFGRGARRRAFSRPASGARIFHGVAALAARFARQRGEAVLSDAGPRDARALAALHAASFHRGWSDGEFESLLIDRNVVAHRAMAGSNLVGFIVSRLVLDEAEILSIAVASSRRGGGLARRLLDLNLRRLVGLGARTVFLEVDDGNVPARKLYRRAGFREVGRREGYYPAGHGALILRRDLG